MMMFVIFLITRQWLIIIIIFFALSYVTISAMYWTLKEQFPQKV